MEHARDFLAKLGWKRPEEKEFIRTAKKPYYLVKLPFRKRYPRVFIGVGGLGSFLIFMSSPVYQFFFNKPENTSPDALLWKGEIARGKTYKQSFIEHCEKLERERAEKRAAKEAAKLAKQTQ